MMIDNQEQGSIYANKANILCCMQDREYFIASRWITATFQHD